jgi:hypothetical protein
MLGAEHSTALRERLLADLCHLEPVDGRMTRSPEPATAAGEAEEPPRAPIGRVRQNFPM